jgi:probable F420-dependent oxidoreductase
MVRRFRFAVGAGADTSPRALGERARLAESLGYSTMLMSDHLLDQLAPLPALAAVAQATSTLRLGTLVLNNDFRHPTVLAQELATIDILSGGRLEIGLGAGWNKIEYTTAGISYDPFSERFQRLTESIHLLKGLFAEGPFSFAGTYYRVNEMDGMPKPIQKPHPPILIGGGGRRALEFAAREAQIVGLAPRLPRPGQADVESLLADASLEKLAWIRQAAGARFDDLELNTYGSLGAAQVTDDARGAARGLAERLNARFDSQLTEDDVLESPHAFIGSVDALVEKCLMLREQFGISYILPGGDPEPFAPVVERLAGT